MKTQPKPRSKTQSSVTRAKSKGKPEVKKARAPVAPSAFLEEAWSTPHFRDFLALISKLDPSFDLQKPLTQTETRIAYSHWLKDYPLSVFATLTRREESLSMTLEFGIYCTPDRDFNLIALKHCCEKVARQSLPFRIKLEDGSTRVNEVLVLQLTLPLEMIANSFAPAILPQVMLDHAINLKVECQNQWKVYEAGKPQAPEDMRLLH